MAEQFKEQGGAATMDPSPLRRWVVSRILNRQASWPRLQRNNQRVERARLRSGAAHRVEYFHQVDDGYSALAAQCLQPLLAHYQIELVCHLVPGPSGDNLPEPGMLPGLSWYDAQLVAPHYGLSLDRAEVPGAERVALAQQILANVSQADFPATAQAVSAALQGGTHDSLTALAESMGATSAEVAAAALKAGAQRREALGHYSGAMFYYGEQWYWGVDRLYHLEQRLRELGAGRDEGAALLYPRPEIDTGSYRDNGSLTLEFYASLRSPYTALIFDSTVELAERAGVRLDLRPVLPMVMRGVPATRAKGFYIFSDAAREARELGVPMTRFADPIGEPVRRCYSLFPWAQGQGKRVALMNSFLNAAFREGINTNSNRGLRKVVERAGLSWSEAQEHLGSEGWQDELERNREAMYAFGSWGVPSYRLVDAKGNTVLWAWGQDRLWLVAKTIQRLLIQA
jgi:2-hydroxychromene-2-carboxylate isomerase